MTISRDMPRETTRRARAWLRAGQLVLAHVTAVLVGFALMVLGLALGVTMIMLPVGLAVGVVGVLIFVWGLLGHLDAPRR